MKQRGRISSAQLSVVSSVEVVERLRAPHDLTDEEVGVWASVTGAEPADWFTPSTVPLLVQYCRHAVQARRVAELIERATGDPKLQVKDYDRLLKIQERESRAIASLATKMRISQQAVINHRANRKSNPLLKPWES